MRAGGRIASVGVGAALALLGSLALGLPAMGHASDFETLTLDFLIGPSGLEVIDAAVVESKGPSYEPFPTREFRRGVALDVLEALQVPRTSVEIDARRSERYHEVGFLVRFREPSLGGTSALSVETTGLQEIAADRALKRLKVSVCGVAHGAEAPDEGVLSELDIEASREGRPPAGRDREACEVWTLKPSGRSISIAVNRLLLPQTGVSVLRVLVAGMAVLFAGGALLAITARSRRTDGPAGSAR